MSGLGRAEQRALARVGGSGGRIPWGGGRGGPGGVAALHHKYIYIYIYIHIYIYPHTIIYIDICVYVWMDGCMDGCMYVFVCVYVRVFAHTLNIYVLARTYIYTYTYIDVSL